MQAFSVRRIATSALRATFLRGVTAPAALAADTARDRTRESAPASDVATLQSQVQPGYIRHCGTAGHHAGGRRAGECVTSRRECARRTLTEALAGLRQAVDALVAAAQSGDVAGAIAAVTDVANRLTAVVAPILGGTACPFPPSPACRLICLPE